MNRPHIPYPVRHPIETFRTAPFGGSIGLAFSSLAVGYAADFADSPEIGDVVGMGVEAYGTVIGGLLVAAQLRLRERVEEVLSESGFEEEYFRKTTIYWCGRQTVRTVLRKTPHLERYKQICEEQKDTAKLRWLPHF